MSDDLDRLRDAIGVAFQEVLLCEQTDDSAGAEAAWNYWGELLEQYDRKRKADACKGDTR